METEVRSSKTKTMVKMAVMIAMVYLATFLIKVPSINGYTHLGDCMIFLSVLILGSKKGALAGGIGAALSDYLGGYMIWVIPTFAIKALMALAMGIITERILDKWRFGWIVGAVAGGIVQIVCYTLIKFPLFGAAVALAELPALILQTISGVVLAAVLVSLLKESGIIKKLREC